MIFNIKMDFLIFLTFSYFFVTIMDTKLNDQVNYNDIINTNPHFKQLNKPSNNFLQRCRKSVTKETRTSRFAASTESLLH